MDLLIWLNLVIQLEGVHSSSFEGIPWIEWAFDGDVFDEGAHDVIVLQLVIVIVFPDGCYCEALAENKCFSIHCFLMKKTHLNSSMTVDSFSTGIT